MRGLESHISSRQAAIGGVLCVAVAAAVGFVHRAGWPHSSAPASATITAPPSVAPSGGGNALGSQDSAAAEAVASAFVSAALGAADDPAETQRRVVRRFDTDRLDAALASSALSDDLTGIEKPARVDGVVLLVAATNGIDARVDVVSQAAHATHLVSVTLRRDTSGWKVDGVVATS